MPDLESFHVMKGKLEERLDTELSERTDIQRAAINHFRKSISRTEAAIQKCISDAIDDLYYINAVLDAETGEGE